MPGIKDQIYVNLRSNPQLQEFLFEFLKLKPVREQNQKTGNFSTDEAVLTHYAEKENVEFCKLLLSYRKLEKARSTYLEGIRRFIEKSGCIIHPDLWLNVAETYRSSSTDPNFQNQPKHGEIIPGVNWSVIRKMYTKLGPKWLFAECDYEGAEVKSAAMESQDQQLIDDLNNDMDMHSHWSRPLFGLQGMEYTQVKTEHKEERFLTKNNFTFATMFGASNMSVAEEMRKQEFFRKYVYEKFYRQSAKPIDWEQYFVEFSEKLVLDCQNQFFDRYKGLKRFYDAILKIYWEYGYVENLLGFRRNYPLKRNEIINFRIQSTSFLLLLDSIIQIEKWLERNPMKSRPISQIHDSMENNIYIPEAGEYIEMVDYFMINKPHLPFTHKIKMGTEWEVGRNWESMFVIKNYKMAA
jgi:DNA polymerase-1